MSFWTDIGTWKSPGYNVFNSITEDPAGTFALFATIVFSTSLSLKDFVNAFTSFLRVAIGSDSKILLGVAPSS